MGVMSPEQAESQKGSADQAPKWRYPGAHSFEDTPLDSRLFFGRRREIDNLVRQVRASQLMVLYGKSGLGKTSLLNAGVFPELRQHNLLPLRVRVNDTEQPLVQSIYAQIERLCREQEIDYTPGRQGCLWEFFKTALFWHGRTLLTPVLVLDQFEELFTLQDPMRRQALATELGELVSGGLPESIRNRIIEDEELDYSEKPPSLKLIISLRWEYVGRLEELFRAIPSILSHRFLLQPLEREQAERAIVEPAQFEMDRLEPAQFITQPFDYRPDVLKVLLDFLTGSEGAIEPYQLQLLCQHAERLVAEKQKAKKQEAAKRIEVDDTYLGGKEAMQSILGRFYLDTIKKLPTRKKRRAARDLCEWGLLTQDGHRIDMPGQRILEDFALVEDDLRYLEDARLLRKEPKFGGYSYELAHDSLAEPIRKRRRFKLPKKVLAGIGGLMVIGLVLILMFYIQAERSANEAQVAQVAEERRSTVTQDLFEKQLNENERLRAGLEAATDQIQLLIDKNEQVAQALQATRVAEARREAEKLTAQVAATRSKLQRAEIIDEKGKLTQKTKKTQEPEMILIKPGKFWMGSDPKLDPYAKESEFPRHLVVIKKAFRIGKYEVSFDEYDTFALAAGRKLPGDEYWGRGRRPVINVSWQDAVAYAQWLSKQTGKRYRLPTEAEWEYAARAGTETAFWWGAKLKKGLANCRGCGSRQDFYKTVQVSSFKPNPFGLHDTVGNVSEWVQDCWQDNYQGAPEIGFEWKSKKCVVRVIRGGSWDSGSRAARSASRYHYISKVWQNFVGFRLAQDL